MKIIVDASNLVIRSLYSRNSVSCEDALGNVVTGAVAGLLECVMMARRHDAAEVIVCFDKGPYLKAEAVAEFKADRKSATTDEERQVRRYNINTFETLCEQAGFTTWTEKGYEADDLIAMCIETVGDYIIIANDSDLYQLFSVNETIKFCVPGSYRGYDEYMDKFAIPPTDLPLYLSIVGTHNGLKGLKGYGPKKTAALFKTSSSIDSFYEEHKEELSRLLEAVYLPYRDTYLPCPKRPATRDITALEQYIFDSGTLLPDADMEYLK